MDKINNFRVALNFNLREFCSPDTFEVKILPELVKKLQRVRYNLNRSIKINSGYRTKKHNKKVGGKKTSQHTIGSAVDISGVGHDLDLLAKELRKVGFKQVIIYRAKNFIHCALYVRNPYIRKKIEVRF